MTEDWGERLRRLRKERGWTAEQLGEHADIDQGQISRYETGKVKNPTDEVLRRLATALGREPGEIRYGGAPVAGQRRAPREVEELLAEMDDLTEAEKNRVRRADWSRVDLNKTGAIAVTIVRILGSALLRDDGGEHNHSRVTQRPRKKQG